MPKELNPFSYEDKERNEEKKILKVYGEPFVKGVLLSEQTKKRIIDQVEEEYQICYSFLQTKRDSWGKRLKLYNNQKRDQDKVGDPLLFTVFNTVLATLYTNKMMARFEAKEEGDADVAENLNGTAEYDFGVMQKDVLDYEWDWDSAFFGRGLVLLNDFDRKYMTPVAQCIDPMLFLRDPRANSVNGDQKGGGAMRFGGMQIGMSKSEMKEHPAFFGVSSLLKSTDIKDLLENNREQRREAQGLQSMKMQEAALGENYEYSLLQWFTKIGGERYLIVLGNTRQTIVRFQHLKGDRWSIIDRTIFPMAHDWDGVSIPDLIEDKQRARSVMINLGLDSAKADLYPMYLFDKSRIKNPNDLNFEFNKFVPVDGRVDNAVIPIQKSLFHQQVNLILNILDVAAQKAVAAPEISQGVQPQQGRTLGESELVMASKGVRHTLAYRIFGWSEKRFWEQWYWLYKTYFKSGIDKKIIRIQGALSPIWREFTPENLVGHQDPDVYVEDVLTSEERRKEEYAKFSQFAQIVMQDPTVSRRYTNRKLGQILGLKKSELMLMFPPTIDEMEAEDENAQIEKGVLPKLEPMEEDIVHIEIHNKALDNKYKIAHIEAHKKMMKFKKEKPMMFPQQGQQGQQGQQPMEGFTPVRAPATAGAGRGTRSVPVVQQQQGNLSPAQ